MRYYVPLHKKLPHEEKRPSALVLVVLALR